MKTFESRALFIYSPQLMWTKNPDTVSTANLNGRSNMRLCPVGEVRAALAAQGEPRTNPGQSMGCQLGVMERSIR